MSEKRLPKNNTSRDIHYAKTNINVPGLAAWRLLLLEALIYIDFYLSISNKTLFYIQGALTVI